MKLKIMIMALLLATAGIGSAVNRLPATEFTGPVDMGGYDIIDAKMGRSSYYVTVGPHDWCDYVTDGTADDVQIRDAYNQSKYIYIIGTVYTSSELIFDTYFELHGLDKWGGSEIQAVGNHTILQIGNGTSNKVATFSIENIEFSRDLNGETKTNSIGIWAAYSAPYWGMRSSIKNCYVHGSYYNIVIGTSDYNYGCTGLTIEDCTVTPNPSDWSDGDDNCGILIYHGINIDILRTFAYGGYDVAGILIDNNILNHARIDSCYINGNGTGQYGIYIANGFPQIVSCGFEDASISNIMIVGATSGIITNSFFGGSGSVGTTGRGIWIDPINANVTDVYFSECFVSYTNGLEGLYANESAIYVRRENGSENILEGITFDASMWWVTGSSGFAIGNAFDCIISNCRSVDMTSTYGYSGESSALFIYADEVTPKNGIVVTGCNFETNHDGVAFLGNPGYCSITDNIVRATSSGGSAVQDDSSQSSTNLKDNNMGIGV